MKRMMIWFGLTVLFLLAAVGFHIYREMGAAPTAAEVEKFEKLSYFKDGKFKNPPSLSVLRAGADEDKMTLSGFFQLLFSSPHKPAKPLPQKQLSPSSFAEAPADNVVYWLGHASAIMELSGKRIGIDLVFDNASPIPFSVKRFQKAPLDRQDLPAFDYVILTHNHYDHLEYKTIRSVKAGHFIVPLGVKTALVNWGIPAERISEIGWGETIELEGMKITAVEGIHFSGRGLTDRNRTLWNSYVIRTPASNIFWGGDSGYGEHYAKIGREYGPFDWAALEIDAWNGGWPEIHMFPEQMLQAAVDLRAKRVLPIHWGAYDMGWHAWDKSINRIVEKAGGKPFELMTPLIGEKLIPGVTPTTFWWQQK